MLDNNNSDNSDYNITPKNMKPNYWTYKLLTWWSGFSLRTKLLAIATLVVSLLKNFIKILILTNNT